MSETHHDGPVSWRAIPETRVPGKRLGRHIERDVRSLAYPAARATALVSVSHVHHGDVLDQGDVGSCTGQAMVDALNTDPEWRSSVVLGEPDALALYELATTFDNLAGAYPPDDTGSTGLAAAKAAVKKGYATGYTHAFDSAHILASLVLAPVAIGVNWYEGFDSPDASGFVSISGQVRGGHEFALVGLDVEHQTVTALNSWGASWGKGGFFTFSFADLARLIDSEQGDGVVLSVASTPPTPPTPPKPKPHRRHHWWNWLFGWS